MTSTHTATPIDEVGELVATLLAAPASRATACRGWTAHELVAHLAAGAAEEAELIEAHLAGDAERATRSLDDRELPFRALPDAELRDRLIVEAARLAIALEQLAAEPAGAVVQFTGRPMSAADFAMHSRSECALHRWDLTGRDDIGWAMLAQPELTAHALTVLSAMTSLPEAPANRFTNDRAAEPVTLVLRSAPDDDVVITARAGTLSMVQAPIGTARAGAELDPAARLLLLWGRREPSAPVDVYAEGDARRLLGTLLGWN